MKKNLLDYPNLVKEFHPTKNGDLKPENVSYGSGKLIWWICYKEKNRKLSIKTNDIRQKELII